MKLSFNWLLELVHFFGSVADLESLLARAGIQVKSVTDWGISLKNIVAAQILEKRLHPKASHLAIYQVADGLQSRQVLCDTKKGYRVGDKVPLALPGTVLPGNVQVHENKLHGITSQGMLCNARELALVQGTTMDRPLTLPEETIIGTEISEVFPPDSILDLDVTPNRGDWLSHLGIAREVAAFTGASIFGLYPSFQRHICCTIKLISWTLFSELLVISPRSRFSVTLTSLMVRVFSECSEVVASCAAAISGENTRTKANTTVVDTFL